MADFSLTPAEVVALSLGRDYSARPDAPLALPPPPARHGIVPPPPDDQLLAAFLELLPEDLYSLQHPVGETEPEQRGRPGPRVAAAAAETLERVVVGAAPEGGDRCCPICLEEMEMGSEARAMGCAHRYHGACILEWLGRRPSCPLCRYQLPAGVDR